MRVELRLSIAASILSLTGLLAGCGKGGEQNAANTQAGANVDPARAALGERIQERFAALDAWQNEAAALSKRSKAGEDVKAQLEELKNKMPNFDDLREESLQAIEADPKDETGFQAIRVALATSKVEYDKDTGSFATTGPEAELEAKLAKHLLDDHVNRPEIVGLYLRLDPLALQDYQQTVFDSARNAEVRANFAALLADHYFDELNKPKLKDEQRTALRDTGMRFVEVIRTEYPTATPAKSFPVPAYLRAEGEVAGAAPITLVQVLDDRIRLLDQSVGATLPNFKLTTVAGKQDALENYRGKVVLVDLWATWCGGCKAAMPNLAKLKEELKGQPFEIVGISVDDDMDALKSYLKAEKLPWVQWHAGSKHEILKTLGVMGYPTYLIVDARGVLRERTHEISEDSKANIRDLVEKASRI